jgi:GNAT superfamily N-acetyltransferase
VLPHSAAGEVNVRRATDADMPAAFGIFRRSIMDYVHRRGIVDSADVSETMLAEAWIVRREWIEHLWRSAAENWIAEGADGQPVGWAMSIQRGEHLELTHFFVDPSTQSKGIGRELLARAFPAGRGGHRSIIATEDPRAMSRYLRSGVRFITTIADFEAAPRPIEIETDLAFERLDGSPESIALVSDVESVLLGHRREVDVAFLLTQRPGWIARRGGAVAGFAFGHRDELTGPIGALDPADIPALLSFVEKEAAKEGATNIYFSTPLENQTAVDHLLGRGYTIDPFLVLLLADDRWLKADRWIHTGLSYFL